MLLQMLAVGGLASILTYRNATIENRYLKSKAKMWLNLMDSLNIKNNLNETFTPINISVKCNFILFDIQIPAGFTVAKLEHFQEEINSYFKGVSTIKKVKFSDRCIVKIILEDLSDFNFEPISCSNSEIYIGKTLDNEPYKVNLTKGASHLLIGAPSGKGKSFLLASILTNLIYNSNNDIDLFLLQMKKGDVGIFERCKPTKYCAYTLNDIHKGLKTLVDLSDTRDAQFNELGIKNLKHFNSHYPNNTMNRVYVVLEEISFFMPNETDSGNIKHIKSDCLEMLKTLVKVGRSSGIHIISVCQRSTVENIPSTMKSMMIRVSLGQLSSIDSINIIESDAAIYLDNKECLVYGYEPGENLVHIPSIDEDFKILQKYVPEIKIPELEFTQTNTTQLSCDTTNVLSDDNSQNISFKASYNDFSCLEKRTDATNCKVIDFNSIKNNSLNKQENNENKTLNEIKKNKILLKKGVYLDEGDN